MARPKKQVKLKEPIKIRLKSLADGNKSIYLDIYWKGVRKYEYLKLYIIPEVNPLCKEQNKETMAVAERIKAERIKALQPGPAGRGGAGALHAVGGDPVSDHGEAHARAVRGAHPEVCRHRGAGGGPQPGGPGSDHAAHRQPHRGELT